MGLTGGTYQKTGQKMAPHRRQKRVGSKEIEKASSFIETSLLPSQAEAKKYLLGRLWKGHRTPQCL